MNINYLSNLLSSNKAIITNEKPNIRSMLYSSHESSTFQSQNQNSFINLDEKLGKTLENLEKIEKGITELPKFQIKSKINQSIFKTIIRKKEKDFNSPEIIEENQIFKKPKALDYNILHEKRNLSNLIILDSFIYEKGLENMLEINQLKTEYENLEKKMFFDKNDNDFILKSRILLEYLEEKRKEIREIPSPLSSKISNFSKIMIIEEEIIVEIIEILKNILNLEIKRKIIQDQDYQMLEIKTQLNEIYKESMNKTERIINRSKEIEDIRIGLGEIYEESIFEIESNNKKKKKENFCDNIIIEKKLEYIENPLSPYFEDEKKENINENLSKKIENNNKNSDLLNNIITFSNIENDLLKTNNENIKNRKLESLEKLQDLKNSEENIKEIEEENIIKKEINETILNNIKLNQILEENKNSQRNVNYINEEQEIIIKNNEIVNEVNNENIESNNHNEKYLSIDKKSPIDDVKIKQFDEFYDETKKECEEIDPNKNLTNNEENINEEVETNVIKNDNLIKEDFKIQDFTKELPSQEVLNKEKNDEILDKNDNKINEIKLESHEDKEIELNQNNIVNNISEKNELMDLLFQDKFHEPKKEEILDVKDNDEILDKKDNKIDEIKLESLDNKEIELNNNNITKKMSENNESNNLSILEPEKEEILNIKDNDNDNMSIDNSLNKKEQQENNIIHEEKETELEQDNILNEISGIKKSKENFEKIKIVPKQQNIPENKINEKESIENLEINANKIIESKINEETLQKNEIIELNPQNNYDNKISEEKIIIEENENLNKIIENGENKEIELNQQNNTENKLTEDIKIMKGKEYIKIEKEDKKESNENEELDKIKILEINQIGFDQNILENNIDKKNELINDANEEKNEIENIGERNTPINKILEGNIENQPEKLKEIEIEIQQDLINDNKSLEDKQELNYQEIKKIIDNPSVIEQNTEDNYKFDEDEEEIELEDKAENNFNTEIVQNILTETKLTEVNKEINNQDKRNYDIFKNEEKFEKEENSNNKNIIENNSIENIKEKIENILIENKIDNELKNEFKEEWNNDENNIMKQSLQDKYNEKQIINKQNEIQNEELNNKKSIEEKEFKNEELTNKEIIQQTLIENNTIESQTKYYEKENFEEINDSNQIEKIQEIQMEVSLKNENPNDQIESIEEIKNNNIIEINKIYTENNINKLKDFLSENQDKKITEEKKINKKNSINEVQTKNYEKRNIEEINDSFYQLEQIKETQITKNDIESTIEIKKETNKTNFENNIFTSKNKNDSLFKIQQIEENKSKINTENLNNNKIDKNNLINSFPLNNEKNDEIITFRNLEEFNNIKEENLNSEIIHDLHNENLTHKSLQLLEVENNQILEIENIENLNLHSKNEDNENKEKIITNDVEKQNKEKSFKNQDNNYENLIYNMNQEKEVSNLSTPNNCIENQTSDKQENQLYNYKEISELKNIKNIVENENIICKNNSNISLQNIESENLKNNIYDKFEYLNNEIFEKKIDDIKNEEFNIINENSSNENLLSCEENKFNDKKNEKKILLNNSYDNENNKEKHEIDLPESNNSIKNKIFDENEENSKKTHETIELNQNLKDSLSKIPENLITTKLKNFTFSNSDQNIPNFPIKKSEKFLINSFYSNPSLEYLKKQPPKQLKSPFNLNDFLSKEPSNSTNPKISESIKKINPLENEIQIIKDVNNQLNTNIFQSKDIEISQYENHIIDEITKNRLLSEQILESFNNPENNGVIFESKMIKFNTTKPENEEKTLKKSEEFLKENNNFICNEDKIIDFKRNSNEIIKEPELDLTPSNIENNNNFKNNIFSPLQTKQNKFIIRKGYFSYKKNEKIINSENIKNKSFSSVEHVKERKKEIPANEKSNSPKKNTNNLFFKPNISKSVRVSYKTKEKPLIFNKNNTSLNISNKNSPNLRYKLSSFEENDNNNELVSKKSSSIHNKKVPSFPMNNDLLFDDFQEKKQESLNEIINCNEKNVENIEENKNSFGEIPSVYESEINNKKSSEIINSPNFNSKRLQNEENCENVDKNQILQFKKNNLYTPIKNKIHIYSKSQSHSNKNSKENEIKFNSNIKNLENNKQNQDKNNFVEFFSDKNNFKIEGWKSNLNKSHLPIILKKNIVKNNDITSKNNKFTTNQIILQGFLKKTIRSKIEADLEKKKEILNKLIERNIKNGNEITTQNLKNNLKKNKNKNISEIFHKNEKINQEDKTFLYMKSYLEEQK